MQAKLPDINSAIVRHRTGALTAMAQLNYSLAATELTAINALLPTDYKIPIDSELYTEKMRGQDVLVCTKCETQTEYDSVIFYKRAVDHKLQLLYTVEKLDFWECPKCHEENPKDGSDRIIRKIQNPFYAECMPEPPHKDKFGNRLGYKYQFEKWFDIALAELENKIGLYRTDYAAQQDGEAMPFEDEDDNGNN